MTLPTKLIHWLNQRQSAVCHRQLLVFSGQEQWAIESTLNLLNQYCSNNILWVGNGQVEQQQIEIKNYRAKLGHEYDHVILNSYSGFRANAVMALSGTIKAQGLMIIICPELSKWPSYADPEHKNRISFGYQEKIKGSFFIQYLTSCIKADSSVAILTADGFSGESYQVAIPPQETQYAEQNIAVESICKVALGHRNRPLVLTADRGRGKSSSLGIAAAKLMQSTTKTLWLSAPRIQNVEQVFKQIRRLLPDAIFTKNVVTYQSSSLTFKPVDRLLLDNNTVDLLLVDEASAIPVHLLSELAKKYSRIVYSSTVHGYEGSGRGFEMRFLKRLKQLKPNFKHLNLQQPIRWHHQDHLEQFWFKTMFQGDMPNLHLNEPTDNLINYCHISKSQLLDNKSLLSNIFSLLIEAHYQTSQDDLQRLLDAPEMECFIVTKGSTLLGVAQIVEEGGEPLTKIADKISDCSRRVKGHLVAQNIASSYNNSLFLEARQWRISRIAIAPTVQNQGLGQLLVDFVEQQAIQKNIKFLTTSFGCNSQILNFWNKCKFLLIKLGAKPEVSSGEHSGICIKPLSSAALDISSAIAIEFRQELLYQLDKVFQHLDENLIRLLLLSQPNANTGLYTHVNMLKQFAMGNRTFISCKRLLREYLVAFPHCLDKLNGDAQKLLVAALLQNISNKHLCEKFNLNGKKQIELSLKTSFKIILENQ